MLDQRQMMKHILRRDPDGWEHAEPTEEDYQEFERWVTEVYGAEVYREYMHGDWGGEWNAF